MNGHNIVRRCTKCGVTNPNIGARCGAMTYESPWHAAERFCDSCGGAGAELDGYCPDATPTVFVPVEDAAAAEETGETTDVDHDRIAKYHGFTGWEQLIRRLFG